MAEQDSEWFLGLMSGTSLDGVDAALLRTDGRRVLEVGPALIQPYEETFRRRLRACLGLRTHTAETQAVEQGLTLVHAKAVRRLLQEADVEPETVRAVGFHGQTLHHDPNNHFTWQIGDGLLLAQETGLPVVYDFRSADVAAGGQGAPLAPIYHAALAQDMPKPVLFLNLGGVGNLTWIGEGSEEGDDLLAFDTGPGNALMDDFTQERTGQLYDQDGALAAQGRTQNELLRAWLNHAWFMAPPPKSLDRNDFRNIAEQVRELSTEDGLATMAAFTATTVAKAWNHLPIAPKMVWVCGGGRHNRTLMQMLAETLSVSVSPIEQAGWNGDAIEAQAFAFLAARRLNGLAATFPGTTGVREPMPGGEVVEVLL